MYFYLEYSAFIQSKNMTPVTLNQTKTNSTGCQLNSMSSELLSHVMVRKINVNHLDDLFGIY